MPVAAPIDQTTLTRPGGDDRCAACDHRRSAHDALSQRYCVATVTASLDRGCICR
jgi:hypothetical protein